MIVLIGFLSERRDPQMKRPITEGNETLEEAYERQRVESLTPEQKRLLYLHLLDQFEAVPSYLEQQARQFVTGERRRGNLESKN
jgi:hypothetical protein